ncbi:MAG: NAD(P)-dependent oxidoreductase [Candidatus Harrisonbacteria bacterium]|nr:NAD(P)-dependent oxidoreductase [Candidatus Harrisonbacteria bacterium]
MSDKKYVITGGLGLIGSLLANSVEGAVTVIDRVGTPKDRLTQKDARIILKDLNALEAADIAGADVIYHCASTVHNYHVLDNPYIDVDTNLKGTIRLLELVKDMAVKPLVIYPSTFFVYGNTCDKSGGKPVNEESATDPRALYPATKLCAESIIKLYSRLYDIPYLIVRLTNVYAEGEDFTQKKKGALSFLIMSAVKGEEVTMYGDGGFYRDYIYVNDVVDALRFLETKAKNDTFLIGYGTPVKFKDIIDYILEQTGHRAKLVAMEPPAFHRAVGVGNFIADTSKINALGWKAKVDYKAGLARVIECYRKLV